jgi:hypothetical protein
LIEQAKFPLNQIQQWAKDKTRVRFGVDLEHLEVSYINIITLNDFLQNHVDSHEFENVFGMNEATFNALPRWRQVDLKKKIGLF